MNRRTLSRLTLSRETLTLLGEESLTPIRGGDSGGGCTVLTTCSPDCCPSDHGCPTTLEQAR
jgi:hypothetical protein